MELVEHLQPSSPTSFLFVLRTTRPRALTCSSQDDLLDSRGGRSSGTTYTAVTSITTNNNTRSNNRACNEVEAGGLRARPTRLFRHYTERFLQPRRLHPSSLGASHHSHVEMHRHCAGRQFGYMQSKSAWCLTPTETVRLIRDGENGGWGVGVEEGE